MTTSILRITPICTAITCKGCGITFDFDFDFFIHFCIQKK